MIFPESARAATDSGPRHSSGRDTTDAQRAGRARGRPSWNSFPAPMPFWLDCSTCCRRDSWAPGGSMSWRTSSTRTGCAVVHRRAPALAPRASVPRPGPRAAVRRRLPPPRGTLRPAPRARRAPAGGRWRRLSGYTKPANCCGRSRPEVQRQPGERAATAPRARTAHAQRAYPRCPT